MTREWDRIQIDGSGNQKAIGTRLLRNGEQVPGLVDFSVRVELNGATLTTVQHVILEPLVTVEEATQALEEREEAWGIPGIPDVPWTHLTEGQRQAILKPWWEDEP